jgi:hypothetical protein
MKIKTLFVAGCIGLATNAALARDNMFHDWSLWDRSPELYRSQELSVDLFGVGTLGESTIEHLSAHRFNRDSNWGAGAGMNYFFCRNLGIGGDAFSTGLEGAFVDNASGNLILRWPITQTGLSPYIYGGAGYQFDSAKKWFGQGGVGLEYRFCPHTGLFIDARAMAPESTRYTGVARLGLRVSF